MKGDKTMRKKLAVIGIALLIALGAGCAVYLNDGYEAAEAAVAAMADNGAVTVRQNEDAVVFLPETPSAGLVFYPGGKVEHTAYAPLLRALAEEDILCVLLEMPFDLAVLDMDAADGIPEQFPEVERWYIGGHSLGGSMAASYIADHAAEYEGVILLAAYSTADLAETGLDVLSLYGSEDGVLNMEKYREYRPNLPETAVETILEGGNHAGFGAYGPQEGDGTATITADEQLALTVKSVMAFVGE